MADAICVRRFRLSTFDSAGWAWRVAYEAGDRPRIRIKIAETFADHDWPVKGFRPKIEQTLPEGFHLTAKGLVRRR